MGYFYCPQHAEETHHPFRVPTVCAVSLAVLVIPMVGSAAGWWQPTTASEAAQTSAASVTTTTSRSPTDPQAAAKAPAVVAAPPAPTITQVPPTLAPSPATPSNGSSSPAIAAGADIPARVLLAYMSAADAANVAHPGCHLQWQFLAALGEIESHHGQIHGSTVSRDGVVSPAIYGPALDGSAAGVIGSVVDGSGRAARAMGPMQFIPSTWVAYGDGGNPQDIDDAALAAANYVCHDGRDLGTAAGRYAAAFSYNHADWYVANVLAIYTDYVVGKPGNSRPATPPPGADPAVNVTTDPAATPVTTPPMTTPPTTDPPAGTPFTTSTTPPTTGPPAGTPFTTSTTPPATSPPATSTVPPATSTPPGPSSSPPTTDPSSTPASSAPPAASDSSASPSNSSAGATGPGSPTSTPAP